MSKQVSRITIISFMIALEVIMTRLLSVNTPLIRISLGFLPIVVVAIFYGPMFSTIAYMIGDIVGALLFPTGAFFPGFTLSAGLTGLIFGVFLYGKKVNIKTAIPVAVLVMLIPNMLLNNIWLYMLMGGKLWAILLSRLIKEVAMCIIQIILIPLIYKLISPIQKKLLG
jgi:ECF transporter S component (folate family)